jgi:hypothetical protein
MMVKGAQYAFRHEVVSLMTAKMGTCFCLFLLLVSLSFDRISAGRKSLSKSGDEHDSLLSRQKRFLIFTQGGGTIKYVAGYLGPIDTEKFINCNAIR